MQQRWPGKPIADRILEETRVKVDALKKRGVTPHLSVVLVGEDPASQVYVKRKIATCESLGMGSTFKRLPESTDTRSLLRVVDELNRDDRVYGILVQMPLPSQIDEGEIINAIDPVKDVDGFHPVNVGRLSLGEPGLFACTPMGVMALLKDGGRDLTGKNAVVVGRSNIVGKPMAQLLLKANCTVTVIHSRTVEPERICRKADIVVVAVGSPGLVTGEWLKEGALVVDVGINEITDPKLATRLFVDGSKKMRAFEKNGRVLYGDVHYDSAIRVAEKVTPVPGGVGRLTIAQLMANCVTAAERSLDQ